MPAGLVWLFAIASGLSVANVYYGPAAARCLGREFAISDASVGGVVTATQIGCALALLLLVPLGDRLNRRRLMGAQLILLIAALMAVSAATSALMLLVSMLAVGLLGHRDDPGVIAYAASAAGTHEQGGWSAPPRAGCLSACCWRGYSPVASATSSAGAGLSLCRAADAGYCPAALATAAALAAARSPLSYPSCWHRC
ncbi:Arabinose efflux permease [Raoultella terrigena]|uniref:Arabinose efflux permease n=1 Tax=Raoultella terrigena TaxID=577 RepID=A0A4U9CT70_RAOTE|nr:Arabinose efflux permease [Raoultella terrigena]